MMRQSRPANLLPKREEGRLVEASRRVLLDGGYPNPERVGCPGSAALRALAAKQVDLNGARGWILHLGSCSPCFIEYAKFQRDVQRRKALQFVLASAALLILAAIGAWAWKVHWFYRTGRNVATNVPYQKVAVDLRNRLILRGEEGSSANSGPIELPRGQLDLTLLLPRGSEPGNYEVGVSTELEKPLVTTTGLAVNGNAITALNVKLGTAKLNPGTYLLTIGRAGSGPTEYPLIVK
jgi:hypothetical protein